MEDVYSLVEAMKTEVNKSGKVTPLNPIYKYYKKALFLKKIKLPVDEKIYRARIIHNIFEKDKPLEEIKPEPKPEDGELEVSGENEEIVEEVICEEEETPPPEPKKVEVIYEKTIIEENKEAQKKLKGLLFCSKTSFSAIAEFRGLIVKDCILDELILAEPKKIVDLTTVTGPLGKIQVNINYYFSLYFSLYVRDLNSNFYKTGRFLMETALNKGYDGIAYLSHFDKCVNYVFFSPRGIAMGPSKQVAIEQPERLESI